MISQNIFLGLGSNLGGRLANLTQAAAAINALPDTALRQISSCYSTEPVGQRAQPEFLNLVAEIETAFSPKELLSKINRIESNLGRVRSERWGPRPIDIDILYWGDLVLKTERLTIPHPETESRRFVLQPLAEIAAEFIAPPDQVDIRTLSERCRDKSTVTWYLPGSEVFNIEFERAHCDRSI